MKYLFSINKDLVELNCLEMGAGLMGFFDGCEKITIGNGKIDRIFTVNRGDRVLQGRSLQNLLSAFPGAERLFIEKTGENSFMLSSPEADFTLLGSLGFEAPRTEEILRAMRGFRAADEKWFRAYENVRPMTVAARNEEIMCLQQLPRVDKYQYQIQTVKKIFSAYRGRVLLCDEVGLGKTIEAGIAMSEYILRGLVKKILILVPASLVDQWYFEMKVMFNQDFIRADSPEFRSFGRDAWGAHNKVIASIASAKRKPNSESIASIDYDLIIVDEAHHLKNRNSVAWQFVNSLRKKYIFLLSATPVQNSLEELYNLITLLKPGQLKTYGYFKRNFVGDSEGLEVKNNARLKELLSGAMIRNRRSGVDIKFTKRSATTYCLPATKKERSLYEAVSRFIREEYWNGAFTKYSLKNLLEQLGSSMHAAASSLKNMGEKDLNGLQAEAVSMFASEAASLALAPSMKLLETHRLVRGFGDKMLIFTKYRTTEDYIAEYLKQAGISTAIFHGNMRRAEKEEQIRRFSQDARVLVSTETGGEGRNLQFCNGIINYDLPWNPMAIEQRIGRIHRIGQQRDVFVYNLCASETVEDYILQVLDKKINMFEMAVGEVDMILGDLEEEDFSEIVMNSWVRANTAEQAMREFNAIGDRLMENKLRYEKIKSIDDSLFASI